MYKIISIVALFIFPFLLKAQEQQVQDGGIWLQGVQIDGRLDEWKQPLAAYNDKTKIHYSIANDDTYLYLAVFSNQTNKIFLGGINFVVQRTRKPELEVIYPYNFAYDLTQRPEIEIMNDRTQPRTLNDLNKIETRGLTGDGDSIIYTTNPYGIFAAISETAVESEIYENGERHYTIEIAIPLVHIQNPDTPKGEISYSLRLRGIKTNFPVRPLHEYHPPSRISNPQAIQKERIKMRDAYIPVEFSGTYHLATKD